MRKPVPAPDAAPLSEQHVLGMAEMGFRGLSEQWLMRRGGDLHWRLIAARMGQREAVFTCAAGQPLYAAFCVTSLRLSAPGLPRLGARLSLSAQLWRVGQSRLASQQQIMVEGQVVGSLRMISTFVGRGLGGEHGNRSIVRRMPRAIALPPEAPPDLAQLARRGARLAARAGEGMPFGYEDTQLPCPSVDFNAAGLLYFPVYAALTDRAAFAQGMPHDQLLITRDTVYRGNVDPGEALRIRLAGRRDGHLAELASARDGRVLALSRSRYGLSRAA